MTRPDARDGGASGGSTGTGSAGMGSAGPAAGGTAGRSDAGGASEERIAIRLVMPDRWLEQVEELALSTTVEEAKRIGLRTMLLRDTDDPGDFYVEYAERQVPDESVTLEELGAQPREILSIRAYDLGHYPRFEG